MDSWSDFTLAAEQVGNDLAQATAAGVVCPERQAEAVRTSMGWRQEGMHPSGEAVHCLDSLPQEAHFRVLAEWCADEHNLHPRAA